MLVQKTHRQLQRKYFLDEKIVGIQNVSLVEHASREETAKI